MMHIMKQMFIAFLAVFLPWVVLLINDNPGGAFVALVLQTTVIGWPVATIWAWRIEHPPKDQSASQKIKEATKQNK